MNKLATRAKAQLQKKTGKKGFTLVEVIVVLVILAILAALLIPSMVKWIDKAHEKEAIVEARTILVSAQTIASEAYEKNSQIEKLSTAQAGEVITLANIGGTLTGDVAIKKGTGTVQSFTYTTAKGKTVVYNADATGDDEKFTVS